MCDHDDGADLGIRGDDFSPFVDKNHPSQFSTKISRKFFSHPEMHFCIAYVASLSLNKKWSPEKTGKTTSMLFMNIFVSTYMCVFMSIRKLAMLKDVLAENSAGAL